MKKKLSCKNFHKVQFYEFSQNFFIVVVQVFIQRKESSYIRKKISKQQYIFSKTKISAEIHAM